MTTYRVLLAVLVEADSEAEAVAAAAEIASLDSKSVVSVEEAQG